MCGRVALPQPVGLMTAAALIATGAEAGGETGPPGTDRKVWAPAPDFPAWPQTSLRSVLWITMGGQRPSVISVYPAKHLSSAVT